PRAPLAHEQIAPRVERDEHGIAQARDEDGLRAVGSNLPYPSRVGDGDHPPIRDVEITRSSEREPPRVGESGRERRHRRTPGPDLVDRRDPATLARDVEES